MLILAIETSTKVGSVALLESSGEEGGGGTSEKILGELTIHLGGNHSASLMPALDHLLQETNLDIGQVQGIALALGPGSFTGLRVGVATVKGLAYALNVPVVGISTLDTLAHNLCYASTLVCPVLDARKNEVYAAIYQGNGSGHLERITPDLVISPEELSRQLTGKGKVIFLGDALQVYGEIWQKKLGAQALFAPPELSYPRAVQVGRLGLAKFQSGQTLNPFSFTPLYLRRSEAEINWELKSKVTKGKD